MVSFIRRFRLRTLCSHFHDDFFGAIFGFGLTTKYIRKYILLYPYSSRTPRQVEYLSWIFQRSKKTNSSPPENTMCTLEKRGNIFILTLTGDDEHRLNPTLIASLRSTLTDVKSQATKGSVLITTAQGKFFSNGFDLRYSKGFPNSIFSSSLVIFYLIWYGRTVWISRVVFLMIILHL